MTIISMSKTKTNEKEQKNVYARHLGLVHFYSQTWTWAFNFLASKEKIKSGEPLSLG
jgi:hypothetical protein